MKKLFLAFMLVAMSAAVGRAQTTINGNQTMVPGASLSTMVPNDSGTGTVLHKVAKLTGSGTAVISGTSDTSNLIGIVAFGAGTSGRASIVQVGQTTCVFDGATTANDYVVNSVTTAGDCHDGGSTLPTVQNLGRVLSTHASGGTYTVLAFTAGGITGTATIAGSISSGQVGVGAGVNTLSGSSALTSSGGALTSTIASWTYPASCNFELRNSTAVGARSFVCMQNNGQVNFQASTDGFVTESDIFLGVGGTVEIDGIGSSPINMSLNGTTGLVQIPSANPFITFGGNPGRMRFNGSSSGSVGFGVAAAAGTPNDILWPKTTGTSGYVLSTDGANPQQLSWVVPITGVTVTGSAPTSGHCVVFSGATSIADSGVVGCTGGGGGGSVTSVSSGNLSPLFTVAVGTPTVTPAFTFTLSNAAADTVFGNCTGSTAAPSYCSLIEAQLPATTVFTDASATFGAFTYDFSGATAVKAKVTAAYAPTVEGQFGINSTTHLPVFGFNGASTITIPVTNAGTTHQFVSSYAQTTGALTTTQPTLADIAAGSAPAGLFDFSTGTFKLPVAAGGTVTANGNILFNSTSKNWLIWGNALSNFLNITPSSVTPIDTDCVKWTVSGGVFNTNDFGYKCVKDFSDLNSFSNGVNNQTGAGYTILSSDGGKDVTLSNGSGQTVTLPSSVPASGWWVDIQNIGAGTWTSNRNGHTIDGGTTNFALTTGLGIRVYSDGSSYYTQRGMGSSASGSVTSVALAAPSGFTISGSPVTSTGTLTFAMPTGWVNGDILVGSGANTVARLAGTISTTPSVYTSIGSGASANTTSLTASAGGGTSPAFVTLTSAAQGDYLCENGSVILVNCVSGVGVNAQTGTTYTIIGGDGGSSDRGKLITFSNASAVAVTLPQAGTTGFTNNFFFTFKNIGAGAVTLTPTTSTVDSGASLKLLGGQSATIYSDDSNYFSTVRGFGSGTTGSISGVVSASCDTGTVTINGAASTMVAMASAVTSGAPGAFSVSAQVSSANTVTVSVCGTGTPTASTYAVRLINP